MSLALDLTAGSASSSDHNLGSELILTIPNNATSTETFVTATTDTVLEGWETIIIKPNFDDPQVSLDPRRPFMVFLADNVANPELLPAADFDADGLPDRWEVANQLDPFDPTDAELDPDKDGLTNAEEYRLRTNPLNADTDGDGIKDFSDNDGDLAKDPDFIEIRLVSRDTGKVNNGQGCAVCHTTELRVGDLRHFSIPREVLTERSYFVRKGSNYTVWLNEVLRNVSTTNTTTGTPTTTATYTAAILPGTNAPAAFVVQDPQTRLGTNKPWSSFPPDPSVAIGALIVPRIEVLFTNLAGNLPVDVNSNAAGGLRVYPDQLSPSDSVARNAVTVRVRTTPPVANQPVRLKSFDVDDPTPWDDDPSNIIDANDNAGFRGNDNRGTNASLPAAGTLAQTVLTLNAQGEATTTFTFPIAPGNNFRVAAILDTPGASAHLDKLQVTNFVTPMFVTSDQEPISGFVGGISPMLTIWRKLHLEFDTMGAPPVSGPEAAFLSGSVTQFRLNYPNPGASQIAVVHQGPEEAPGLFERGKLELTGIGSFAVGKSWTVRYSNDRLRTVVEISGAPTAVTNGQPAKLYDDDDRYLANDTLYPSILGLQSPPLPALSYVGGFLQAAQPRFGPAYISLVDANALGWNTVQTISFKRYAAAINALGSVAFDSGNLQLKGADRSTFWAFSVVFGYEPQSLAGKIPLGYGDDGDPDREIALSGGTPKTSAGFSAIYMESIREQAYSGRLNEGIILPSHFTDPARRQDLTNRYVGSLYGVIAHEICHAPGGHYPSADHAEEGIMAAGAPTIDEVGFTPATVRRLREATKWIGQ